MQRNAELPPSRELLLVGGGHSHALLLAMLAMKPLPGVSVTLASDFSTAAYSGMLPGHIAGLYSHDEMHIDLRRLANAAGANFLLAPATGIDATARKVHFAGRPSVSYDVLSLNAGSFPADNGVPGVRAFAIPAKPVPQLLAAWNEIAARTPRTAPRRLTVAGGGAGGVELVLAIRARLGGHVHLTLITKDAELLPQHSPWLRWLAARELERKGIKVRLGDAIKGVERHRVLLQSGGSVEHDEIFWVTTPSPHPWLAASGFPVDAVGFLRVDENLRVVGEQYVFAAGDAATLENAPRPKSGVYAVRHARPLERNLRALFAGEPLVPFTPQLHHLSLIGTGDGRAIGGKGVVAFSGRAVWTLKDRIDRAFMAKFSSLPPAPMARAVSTTTLLAADKEVQRAANRCSGCGSKVGGGILIRALARLNEKAEFHPEDAAVVRVPAGQVVVQSVDLITELVSDPYTFGVIAANHAMSDLFARGAEPHSAHVVLQLPYAAPHLIEEKIFQWLSGINSVLGAFGAVVLGGHTLETSEAAIGLCVNGTGEESSLLGKNGLQPGEHLILTKALGTGVVFAAAMQGVAPPGAVDAAVASMLVSNGAAAKILRQHKATAMTDVTGFGLAGHLTEMLKASSCAARLQSAAVPALPGVSALLERGVTSTLSASNVAYAGTVFGAEKAVVSAAYDPQTNGGLLAGVAAEKSAAVVTALRAAGYLNAAVIGQVVAKIEGESWLGFD